MGVEVGIGFIFLREMVKQHHFKAVFEHVGMIASVKSVSVT